MIPLYCVLIEADPVGSLGGSCIRDIYNTANYLIKIVDYRIIINLSVLI